MQAGHELDELVQRLSMPLPEVPPRYFYDGPGAQLFEAITEQPEYYPTRTELGLLRQHADAIIELCRPVELAELGSGVGEKIQLLVEAGRARELVQRLVFFDVNAGWLEQSVREATGRFPGLDVRGVQGDFHRDLPRLGPGGRRLVLFLAGTIGNLPPARVGPFLSRLADAMAPDDWFLVGVDLVKDVDVLHRAYNDAAGVTAAFNRNILGALQRRFGARLEPQAWRHRAFYDVENAWIEMRLQATRETSLALPSVGFERRFAPGDELRTELSCKYTEARLRERLAGTGLQLHRWMTDEEQLFALALVRPSA